LGEVGDRRLGPGLGRLGSVAGDNARVGPTQRRRGSGTGAIVVARRGGRSSSSSPAAALAALVAALFLALQQRRRVGDGGLALDDQVAQHGVVEAEGVLQLVQRLLVALDVHQHVVCLVDLVDRVGQLAPPPVLQAVDLAAAPFQVAAVPLDHRRHLLALARMNQKHHFVMSHVLTDLRASSPSAPEADAVRQGDPACPKPAIMSPDQAQDQPGTHVMAMNPASGAASSALVKATARQCGCGRGTAPR
jgi:hypothetical protein